MTDGARLVRLALLARISAAIVLAPAMAGAQTIGYTAAVNGVRSSYPTENVDSVYVFNTVDFTSGPFQVAATVPWMRIATRPSDGTAASTEAVLPTISSGIGDPFVRVDVRVLDSQAYALRVGAAAGVKLPVVAADSGRGTGEADYAIGGNVFKSIDRTSLMADVLYWKYGDPPGEDYTDAWSYSLGAAQVIGNGRWSAVAAIAGSSAGLGRLQPPLALNFGALTLVGRQSLAIIASIGLNDASSGFSVGTTWRVWR